MFLWNAFFHKRRVVADAVLGEAVAEFTAVHRTLVGAGSSLRRFFVLHLINLWEQGLLDAGGMDAILRVQ